LVQASLPKLIPFTIMKNIDIIANAIESKYAIILNHNVKEKNVFDLFFFEETLNGFLFLFSIRLFLAFSVFFIILFLSLLLK
jgi:hypothetical protein